MAKYIIDSDTLEGLGDAIRSVNGATRKYTPEEMVEEVMNLLNAATFILVDKDGNEYPAMYVESDFKFTATANDIRKGTVAITAEGVTTGTKEIPAYYTQEGYCFAISGSKFSIPFYSDDYDFTKLQAIICPFAGSISTSVAADRVCIDNSVYAVNSADALSSVIKDAEKREINLNIVNDSDKLYLIRYFTYREVH